MTDVGRILSLQTAKHTDVNTFTNTPGTLRWLDPEEQDFYPRDSERLERKLFSTDNRRFAATVGRRPLDPRNLKLRLRGVNGNAGGAIVSQSATEVGELFDSFFGANAVDPAGAATTITGGVGATPTLLVTSGAGFANGDMVLFATTAPAGFVAREVVSGGGTTTLTLDRTYTGTPVNASVPFRGPRWAINRAVHKHVHQYFRAEFENGRADFFGCIGESLDFDFKEGDVVRAAMSWRPNDWSPQTEANPTWAGATAGSEIVAINGSFWLANTEYLVKSLKLSFKNKSTARDCVNGVNGVNGYEVTDKDDVMLTGQVYLGDNAGSLGELVYNGGGGPSVATLQTSNTARDLAIELNTGGAGASFYGRMPAADLRGDVKDSNGLLVYDFRAYACEPASGSPFRFTLF